MNDTSIIRQNRKVTAIKSAIKIDLRYKGVFEGPFLLRSLELAIVYGIIAMVPVLWLTFSTIDITRGMLLTWLLYGFIRAFAAGIVFAKLNP